MSESADPEKRKLARWRTSRFFSKNRKFETKFFNVVNEAKEESIGHLVDLSIEGLKTIGGQNIEQSKPLRLRIDFPREVKGVKRISIVAHCLWCDKDEGSELYMAGYKIISTAPPAMEIIETLVGE